MFWDLRRSGCQWRRGSRASTETKTFRFKFNILIIFRGFFRMIAHIFSASKY